MSVCNFDSIAKHNLAIVTKSWIPLTFVIYIYIYIFIFISYIYNMCVYVCICTYIGPKIGIKDTLCCMYCSCSSVITILETTCNQLFPALYKTRYTHKWHPVPEECRRASFPGPRNMTTCAIIHKDTVWITEKCVNTVRICVFLRKYTA